MIVITTAAMIVTNTTALALGRERGQSLFSRGEPGSEPLQFCHGRLAVILF